MTTLTAFLLAFPGIAITSILIPGLALRWFLVALDRRRTEICLVVAALIEPAAIASQLIANSLTAIRPFKFDAYVFEIDRVFGNPSFRIGAVASHHLWLHNLIGVSYGLLPAAVLAVFVAHLYLVSESDAIQAIKAFVILFFGASIFYLAFPVSGPVYAFPTFPTIPIDVIVRPLLLHAPPNGVPSCHTGAALLCVWFAWRWTAGRVLSLTFLGLTILATLGSGQHYAFDLVCAIPYSALVLVVARPKRATQPVYAGAIAA